VTRRLTTRPNLDHLRGQAKMLLADLRDGKADAARTFIAHLPKARKMSPAQARAAEFRLADAQSVVARQSGFASWPSLAKHVEQLRAIEGEWHFEFLQIDGTEAPRAMLGASRLLIDGDHFRMESPEANYDGRFSIDAATNPMEIDIEFVEGPEAGNQSYGIFELDGDRLALCLGMVGAPRPTKFATHSGSGHALERLHRASASRPERVTGGIAPGAVTPAAEAAGNPADFVVETDAMLTRLEGKWLPVRLVTAGEEMRKDWLAFGARTSTRNEAKVVFGGQVMLHVKMRIDTNVVPTAVDYLHLNGRGRGQLSKGIMQWIDDDVCFLIAAPGQERPIDFVSFDEPGLRLSQWKRAND
jgi:uncharacterized protein (TIGR03067 family)